MHSPLFPIDLAREPALCDAPLRYSLERCDGDWEQWRAACRDKLSELLGMAAITKPESLAVQWGEKEAVDYGSRQRFSFTSEPGVDVPGYILWPATPPERVIICLQGHSSGMHISLGIAKEEGDEATIAGGRDFAVQAVKRGYAAVVIEQRCFGERQAVRGVGSRGERCHRASMNSLLMGRTMIGERVWDISRTLDLIEATPALAGLPVYCMGNSGGGTATYYAAALEPRLAGAMPSCAVCEFRMSITPIDHCVCNYVPGLLNWFEMGDLGVLIAPRPLLVVAGRTDPIFPLEGVRKAFSTIEQAYARAGAPASCRLLVGEGGHQFFPDEAWPAFESLL